ncbi:MAG: DUF3224 domain-containing protein [Dehalococcoidia bacterium]
MTTRAIGTFAFKHWDEVPYGEDEGGARLTHSSITNDFHGDVEGEGTLQYLMIYRHDGEGWNSADFVGFERISGRIGDRSGSFVLKHAGTYTDGVASASVTVMPGSGTGDLRGLRGEGSFVARHNVQPTPLTLDYNFDQ